mmetsp:Transcript_11735/g.14614  ORF Transcript_11735/g.14614 Transcript_11735/m.14614 type:complete len:138 (+) Transcript_11735:101-514(+)
MTSSLLPAMVLRNVRFGGIGGRGRVPSSSLYAMAMSTSSVSLEELNNKSNYVQSRQASPYKLGKHRSNALELIQKQPVIEVDGDMAVCDGGGGALGHPLEYIKVGNRADYASPEEEAQGVRCIYCGLRYRKKQGGGH